MIKMLKLIMTNFCLDNKEENKENLSLNKSNV